MKWFLLLLLLLIDPASAASRFGVCSTTCTWDAASTAMWSATTGGTTGASVPGAADDVTLDANTCVGGTTCTITVNTNFTIKSLTDNCTASTTGCILDFSVNNNSGTIHGGFTNSSGTNTIKLGSGTFIIDNACSGCSAWTVSGSGTNIQAGTSTINIITTNLVNGWAFQGGSNAVYNNVNISGTSSSGGDFEFDSAAPGTAFNNLTISGTQFVVLNVFGMTINNFMAINGTSTNQIGIITFLKGHQTNISGPGLFTANWAGIRDVNIVNNKGIATNSMLYGNNAGINTGGTGSCILGG